jgi:hypothetical protein
MKITAIGVHSAFATGSHKKVISVEQVRELILKTAHSPNLSQELILAEIDKRSQRLYTPKWHSNFLIEFDMPGKRGKSPYRLLLHVGADIRHGLKALGLSSADIDGVYISHPYNDHIGGMEYLALTTFFNPFYTPAKPKWLNNQFIAEKLFLEYERWPPGNTKPDLFVNMKVLDALKKALGPGLDTLQAVPDVSIETYFDIHLLGEEGQTFQDTEGSWTLTQGISLQHSNGYNVLMPTDIQSIIPRANRIYIDCKTSPYPSDKEIQKKCLLYHYDKEPEFPEGMFYGVLKPGDSHTYPDED